MLYWDGGRGTGTDAGEDVVTVTVFFLTPLL